MIMVLVYNLADTFFIGQTKNAYMVAAVSIATPFISFCLAIGVFWGWGDFHLCRMLGEGRKRRSAKRTSHFFINRACSRQLTAIDMTLLLSQLIYHMVGASDDTIGYAKQYLGIVSVGIPFLIVSNSFSNIIRADGNAGKAMLGVVLGNLANIILDPVMILGFGWNVAGAAVATVIGNIVSTVVYLSHLVSDKTMLSIKPAGL